MQNANLLSEPEISLLRDKDCRRAHIGPIPEGSFAPVVAEALSRGGIDVPTVLYVAPNRREMEDVARQLRFWNPALGVITFPPWDCEPYDRASPSTPVMVRRLASLARLTSLARKPPDVVVCTAASCAQKVVPRKWLETSVLRVSAGRRCSMVRVREHLARFGYERVQQVNAHGEYAVRGGLLDVFPAGRAAPLRLDFFGDELDTIRSFEIESQRSTGSLTNATFLPAREVMFDEDDRERYFSAIHRAYGVLLDDDPVYVAVRDKRYFAGVEHWMPWFAGHGGMETIFDYLPSSSVIVHTAATSDGWDDFDERVNEALTARVESLELKRSKPRSKSNRAAAIDKSTQNDTYNSDADISGYEPAYYPIPKSDGLYLSPDIRQAKCDQFRSWSISAFSSGSGNAIDPDEDSDGGSRDDSSIGRSFGAEQVVAVHPAVVISRSFVRERRIAEVNLFDAVSEHIHAQQRSGKTTILAAGTVAGANRIRSILLDRGFELPEPVMRIDKIAEDGRVIPAVLDTPSGFAAPGVELLSEVDILGEQLRTRPRSSARRAQQVLREFSTLGMGDYLVHIEHGIGRFAGLHTLEVGGARHDCLALTYAGDDRLYVPVESLDLISRYGAADSAVELDRLGSKSWQARKAKLKNRLHDMAAKLVVIAAKRMACTDSSISAEARDYDEFCARFRYPETTDQISVIAEVIEDLSADHPMDRLVCGDVGFGKTEVAMRAAFCAAVNGIQTALIAPTTLLARQHLSTFSERFAGLGINVVGLSRLVSTKDATEVRSGIASGSADIVIGTHALLAKSVSFRNLGLVVVDEEQRFGVAHKERLKQLKDGVNVLTLSATPIPRTMQLSMAGIRDLSLITTPPWDRLAVQSTVGEYDPVVVRTALRRESARDGQSFVVCPRIRDLVESEIRLRAMVPELSLAVAHGQMPAKALEKTMIDFYNGNYDILLATPIIESGLDIPNANTLIVERADRFGLAQLYQIRGRIGRSRKQGYALFTVPDIRRSTEGARRRLRLLQSLDSLGAGFTLASHDLDMRGAGNLLGEEQSGHVREVGIELYQQMLDDAVAELTPSSSERSSGDWSPQINLGLNAVLSEEYISDLNVRLSLYRRVADLKSDAEVVEFAAELQDRFGKLPTSARELLQLIKIKLLCQSVNVDKIDAGSRGISIRFHGDSFAAGDMLARFVLENPKKAVLRSDKTLAWLEDVKSTAGKVKLAVRLLTILREMVSAAR